jgi:hypothetical protein
MMGWLDRSAQDKRRVHCQSPPFPFPEGRYGIRVSRRGATSGGSGRHPASGGRPRASSRSGRVRGGCCGPARRGLTIQSAVGRGRDKTQVGWILGGDVLQGAF